MGKIDPLGRDQKFIRRKPKDPTPNEAYFQHGKVPPQSVDLEEVVLGAIMTYYEAPEIKDVLIILDPVVFYKEANQVIAKAIMQMIHDQVPIDPLLVTDRLRKNGDLETAGGPFYISTICGKAANWVNAEFHYRIVQQKFLQREIIRISSEMIKESYDDMTDVFELVDKLKIWVKDLDNHYKSMSKSSNTVVNETMQIQENFANKKHTLFNYHTPWKGLNERIIIGPRKFVLIAGGAKHGKTRFTAALLFYLLETFPGAVSVYWNTFEDSAMDLIYHYVATKLKIKTKALQTGKAPAGMFDAISYWINQFRKFDIQFVDETTGVEKITTRFKAFCGARPNTLNILVIDNILALKDKTDQRFKNNPTEFYDFAIAEISQATEAQNAFVVALHHYNDEQENPENLKKAYRPVLRNIKGSEASRRKPTYVLLINNPGVYKDLMSEYSGDAKDNLKDLFIVEVAADRDDDIHNEEAVLRFWKSLDFNIFEEITDVDAIFDDEEEDKLF